MTLTDSISRDRPVLIAGPTASGKSALAMELAARDGRIVINADALQVYGNWRVLTARPSLADEAALPHALYGHVAREAAYSVGDWLRDLAPLLTRPVVIVGGTGLYFSALTEGLVDIPPTPPHLRALADARRAAEGLGGLLAELDASSRDRIDTANPMRVQRAWEVLQATGRGIADWQAETGAPLLSLDRVEALVLRPDTGWLDARITRRFDAMLAAGALDEARREAAVFDPGLPSSKAIGAGALISHLRGERTLEQARSDAILASRQYAKRQRTWFRTRMKLWRDLGVS